MGQICSIPSSSQTLVKWWHSPLLLSHRARRLRSREWLDQGSMHSLQCWIGSGSCQLSLHSFIRKPKKKPSFWFILGIVLHNATDLWQVWQVIGNGLLFWVYHINSRSRWLGMDLRRWGPHPVWHCRSVWALHLSTPDEHLAQHGLSRQISRWGRR